MSTELLSGPATRSATGEAIYLPYREPNRAESKVGKFFAVSSLVATAGMFTMMFASLGISAWESYRHQQRVDKETLAIQSGSLLGLTADDLVAAGYVASLPNDVDRWTQAKPSGDKVFQPKNLDNYVIDVQFNADGRVAKSDILRYLPVIDTPDYWS